jgi:glycine/D-amino acid oxidase-like deaminating enzyme
LSGSAVVVGAGVFGVSTARELARRGWDVRVIEQYAAGNVRSGSGGDTRLLRFSHGDVEWYTLLARRALDLWRELEAETGVQLFEPVGLAWFETGADDFTRRSERTLLRLGIACERLTPDESKRLFPSLGVDDLRSTLFEPGAGVLWARLATRTLARGLRVESGRVSPAAAPGADVVVWACGSWLPGLFPGLVRQRVSRRDVFYAGVDAGWSGTPAFCDYAGPYYGHGELGGLGLEFAWDGPGAEIDPDALDRVPDAESERVARAYLGRRFPALAGAPLVGARVCQYDLTADTHFLFDRHPGEDGWWLLGGGSGHGFKHGPALAEYVADCIEGRREPEAFHALGPRVGHAGLRTAAVET